jgi:hypothetical protein
MTQDVNDLNGQPPGPGHAGGGTVPDDDRDGARPGTPATRFEKVASGSSAAETVPQAAIRDAEVTGPGQASTSDAAAADPEPGRALGGFGDPANGSLLPDSAEFRTRWQQVQSRFVDDPRGSVTEAADVLAHVTAELEAAIAERQRALRDRWTEGQSADTESLRETLLMYRALLHQLTR